MIPVYKAERDAGLTAAIHGAGRVTASVLLEPAAGTTPEVTLKRPKRAIASVGDADLYWFKARLVTSGWNLNGHFFTVPEIWASRTTPEDKPVNVSHTQTDIIGHTVAVASVDGADAAIPDDTADDELPDVMHLIAAGVIYNKWEDEKVQERVTAIIKDINAGTLKVSMETWYKNFDYVLENETSGERRVVARNKETAFLSKHVRFLNPRSTGVYQGEKVGMLLKGLTFAGMGLVTDPANPLSDVLETQDGIPGTQIVTAATTKENSINSSVETTSHADVLGYARQEPEKLMATENTIEVELKAENARLTAALKAEQDKQVEAVAKQNQELNAKCESLAKANETLTAQVTQATEQLTKTKAVADEALAELAKAREAGKAVERLAKVKAAYGLGDTEADLATATKLIAGFAKLTDDDLKGVLETQAAITAAVSANGGYKKVAELALTGTKATAGSVLDTAKVDADAALATAAAASTAATEMATIQAKLAKRYENLNVKK